MRLRGFLAGRRRVTRAIRGGLHRHPRLLALAISAAALAIWVGTGWAAWFVYDVTERPGTVDLRGIGNMARATTVLDAHDQPVFTFFKEQRIEVPLSAVSPHLIRAVLAVEDQRFFRHSGMDLVRIAGAAIANIREGRASQGGSTITQQLARQSYLTREKTISRKLRELVLAARIEQAYTKEQILQLYLNKVYFGNGLYGVEAAARGYLGKPAAELAVAEAALLAGLIKSPSTYAPTVNLPLALSRRNVVLQALLHTGSIDRATFDRAQNAEVTLRNTLHAENGFGLYFKEHVRRELVSRFGLDRVYEGGLRVFTTLEPALQKSADELVEKYLARIESRPRYPHVTREESASRPAGVDEERPSEYLQGALVAIDPGTGHVKAMVGGRDFNDSHFNRAVQAERQAGSAFKPFVYAAALEAGFTPATLVDGLDDPILTPEGDWVPEDAHSEAAEMTVRTALRTSSNRAAVRVLRSVGIQRAVDYAARLNLGSLPGVPSLALGAGTVRLVDMATAFGAFANDGVLHQPMLIRRVEDDEGRVLFEAELHPKRAISRATSFLMANMLADVINAGTGFRARREGFTLPAAGKTGTTNDFKDAWFIGFTPNLVAGVWIGFDQPKTIVPNGYGGELAVPLWAAFMRAATRGHRPVWLERPPNIVNVDVCRLTGKRPADGCHAVEVFTEDGFVETRSAVYTEYFVRGTEPITTCDLHGGRSIFRRLANFVGGRSSGEPAFSSEVGLPPRPVEPRITLPTDAESTAEDATTAAEPEAQKKRRGFWSRLFGIGRGDDDDDEEDRRRREDGRPRRPPR